MWRLLLFVQLQKRQAEICQGAEAGRAITRDGKDHVDDTCIPQPEHRHTGAGRPVQPCVPRGTTAKMKYTKAVSALMRKRAWREGLSRCSQVSAGAGAKKMMEHGLTQRLVHPSYGGQNLKVTFWTGSYLSRIACPSMPCYNVMKTATKLVTDNVANTTGYYYVNDILYVLQ